MAIQLRLEAPFEAAPLLGAAIPTAGIVVGFKQCPSKRSQRHEFQTSLFAASTLYQPSHISLQGMTASFSVLKVY